MNLNNAIDKLETLSDDQLLALRCDLYVKANGSLTHNEERQAASILLPYATMLLQKKGLKY